MNERQDLLDETLLRRALRLEADERVPFFDLRAIALVAQRTSGRRAALGALAGAGAVAITARVVWSAIFAAFPSFAGVAMAAAIDLAVALATLLLPVAEFAAQPAVPLSLLAALGVGILHELRERREHVHAGAS